MSVLARMLGRPEMSVLASSVENGGPRRANGTFVRWGWGCEA